MSNAIARQSPAGVYLHWPFCERKCPYCDFYTFGREHPWHVRQEAYLESLIEEIVSAPERLGFSEQPSVDTIYFGGGTPSLMPAEAFARLLQAVSKVFTVANDSEVTLEINPTSAEQAALEAFLAEGLNRLSVGCQSFNDEILARLGRTHDGETARRAIARFRSLGIDNLSLDVIFATPGQTMDDLRNDLETMLSFSPAHISAYGLTLHEGTPYARWSREGKLALPDEDRQAQMYEYLLDALADAGFEHYEISNWSQPGLRSRHNSKYWQRADVYAFGVSAHGCLAGQRYVNPADLTGYIEANRDEHWAVPEDPPKKRRAQFGEIMMLALRRTEGVSWDEINAWAGNALDHYYAPELSALRREGLLTKDENSVRLSRKGLLLADYAMERFF